LLFLFVAVLHAATWQAAVDSAAQERPGAVLVVRVSDGQLVAAHNRRLAENTMAAPGSAIKPFTLAALVDAGRLPAHADWICSGHLNIAGHNLACTHPKSAAPLDAVAALAYSCNEFFAHFAAALPPERLRATLESYGFDAELTTTTDDLKLQALGEARVRITPEGLLNAYRKLALTHRDLIVRGMEASAQYGTSRGAAIPGWKLAGKTGTGPGYGWFAGFGPSDRPEWVFLVAVPHGSGSGDAAPLAHDILARYREVSPPGEVNVEGRRYNLEDYVAGVLAGEAGIYKNPQSLRAMAIAARTYAVRFRGRHQADGYDFCSLTHCQNFKPTSITPAIRNAVEATSGELLWYEGSPAAAYYSQDCGGITEAGGEPYLKSRPDPACIRKGRLQWSAQLPMSVEVLTRTPSGRAANVRAAGRTTTATDFRLSIGRTLGWNLVRSDLYSAHGKTLTGYGSGHGIGLCQNGAEAMASEGASDRDILAAYYPGTSIGLTAKGLRWRILSGERVDLWTTDPAQQRWIPIAESAIRAAEARAALTIPGRVRLQIFPTLDTFRNATGESGNVLASTRGTTIRTQPTLDAPTLRHEAWHALIESRVSPTVPDWFREGLALAMTEIDPRTQERKAQKDRVRNLIAKYGEKSVLSWIVAGVPK